MISVSYSGDKKIFKYINLSKSHLLSKTSDDGDGVEIFLPYRSIVKRVAEDGDFSYFTYDYFPITLVYDPTSVDTDGDLISDTMETNGIPTNIGDLKTNSKKKDTDGDGLSDNFEIGKLSVNDEPKEYSYEEELPKKNILDKDKSITIIYKVFRVKSNPLLADSDNDSIEDNKEKSNEAMEFNALPINYEANEVKVSGYSLYDTFDSNDKGKDLFKPKQIKMPSGNTAKQSRYINIGGPSFLVIEETLPNNKI